MSGQECYFSLFTYIISFLLQDMKILGMHLIRYAHKDISKYIYSYVEEQFYEAPH